jgi:tetratricopeptide (TPR) repeat protein
MTRMTLTAISAALFMALTAGFAISQEQPAEDGAGTVTAEEIANQAISELAAWRNKAARQFLKKEKPRFGSTPEFKTAWALLEIQDGTGNNEKMADRGLKNLTRMTKKASVDEVASFYRGEVLYHQKKRGEAYAAWQAAAEGAGEKTAANPKDATAQFYLGASLVRAKEFGNARKALKKAKREGFDPAMVQHQVGLSYLFDKQWEKARREFDKGLEIDPRYAPMYFWRAMAWDKLGRTDNMLIDLDQYVNLAPNAPDAGKARALLSAGSR